MREIKFRAWRKATKEMFIPKLIANPVSKNNEAIMQSTNLLDKNNKEIYEGDIVKVDTEIYFDSEDFIGDTGYVS